MLSILLTPQLPRGRKVWSQNLSAGAFPSPRVPPPSPDRLQTYLPHCSACLSSLSHMQTVLFISRAIPLFPSWSAWSQASKLCEDGDTNWRGETNRMAGIHPGPALVTLEQPSEQLLCRVTCLGSLFSPQSFQYRNTLGQINNCCVPVREPDLSGLSPHSIWKVEGRPYSLCSEIL